jgi:hypothetical protein
VKPRLTASLYCIVLPRMTIMRHGAIKTADVVPSPRPELLHWLASKLEVEHAWYAQMIAENIRMPECPESFLSESTKNRWLFQILFRVIRKGIEGNSIGSLLMTIMVCDNCQRRQFGRSCHEFLGKSWHSSQSQRLLATSSETS